MNTSTTVTPFIAEGKSLRTEAAANGDLTIEGWAVRFDGTDRQGENFIEGAFADGVKAFVGGNRPLCYHHKHDMAIGEVLSLTEVPGQGAWLKARVDYQPESSPLHWIYSAIKKGSIKGLSVGGFFRRKLTAAGQRIAAVDLTEVSVTPVPVHARTGFAVVEGKALSAGDDGFAGIAALATEASAQDRIAWLDVKRDLANLRVDTAILAARTRADALTL